MMPRYRIRRMGGGIYRDWWLVERRIWWRVFGIPIGWHWRRVDYFEELKWAQNWVLYGGDNEHKE